MIKILFVCHGNICRSPMAEFIMKHLVEREGKSEFFQIASAATSREEIGNDIHIGTKRQLEKYNIKCTKRAARQMTKKDYEQYDLLIGMDEANIKNMLRICGGDEKHKISSLLDYTKRKGAIADPWYTGNFEDTYRDIMEGCTALLEYIKENRM